MKKTPNNLPYQTPELELIEVKCEQGFATSIEEMQYGDDIFA